MSDGNGSDNRGEAFGSGTQSVHAKAFNKAVTQERVRERAQRAALWAQFACAALASGMYPGEFNSKRSAAAVADEMLAEYDERWGSGE